MGNIEIIALSKKVSEHIIVSQIYKDMNLCFACLAFIWLYVTIHLQSLFKSTVSMLNIGLSIPIGLIILQSSSRGRHVDNIWHRC
jgi:hypothetical protein